MKEHQLFSIYCGNTLIDVIGYKMSMDEISDYRIANTDISVLEMILELDKAGKFEQDVHEMMYEVRNA